jgi:hypothetical protein
MEYIVIDGGGKKVSKKKAAEIIRRTDAFYERLYTGNNHEFNRTLYRLSGVRADYQAIEDAHTCCDMDYGYMLDGKNAFEKIRAYEKWKVNEWGCLGLKCFYNHWISCAYIGGPYGWISPEGEIGGLLYGGKHGIDDEDLEEDLKKIATEWPNLEFTVYHLEYEGGEDDKFWVYTEWKVKKGEVEKVKEDYEVENITYETIDEEVYREHLKNAEDPECWWSLKELKKLWPGKLTSGGKKAEG